MFIENKVALVTGGASGIGLMIVQELLKNGAKGVTIADVNSQRGNASCNELGKEFGNGRIFFVKTDVTDKTQFEAAMKKTIETFKNFDILVNNAGILADNMAEKEILINLNGVMNGCILAMDFISKHKQSSEGMIVNVASILGLESAPMIPIYVATKHGVVGLSKSLSAKVHYDATRVKIVTICPGFTDTPLLKDLEGKYLNDRCFRASLDFYNSPDYSMQSVDQIRKAIVPILNQAENGSFWVIDGENISSVHLPEIKELKKLQTINV